MRESVRPARIWYQSFVHPIEQAPVMARLQAERAFVIGHFQEPGLLEIRGAVDMPVIGLGEASMLAALTMGHRFGLVTINPVFIDWHDRQVRAHGLDARVAGVRAIHADLAGFMRAFTDESICAQVRAEFIDQVRPLVTAGAEVVIPAGGLPMLLFARECPFVVDGAVVLNGIATVAKAAEMALALHRLTGAAVSRRSTYAKASPECENEFPGARW